MRHEPRGADMMMFEPGSNLDRQGPPLPNALTAGASDPQTSEPIWKLVDDRLHGRWRWAILTALALSSILGLVGYFSAKPMFESVGFIEIQSQPSIVMNPTYEGIQHQSNYEKQVATQIQHIKGRRCLEAALNDEQLSQLPWARQRSAINTLKDHLDVDAQPPSELVRVSFKAEDPVSAEAGLNAVLRTYDHMYAKNGGAVKTTLTTVNDWLQTYTRDLNNIRSQRQDFMSKYRRTDLHALQNVNSDDIGKLETQIETGKFILDSLAASQARAGAGMREVAAPSPLLEKLNPNLLVLRSERDKARNEFTAAQNNYMPGSPTYTMKKRNAETAEASYQQEYQNTVKQYREWGAEALQDSGDIPSPERVAAMEKKLAEKRQLQGALVQDLAVFDDLTRQEEDLHKRIDQANARKEDLEREKDHLNSIISVAQYGNRPDEPSNDARRKRAILGLGLGLMASFGAFFVLGSIDRRAFAARQLAPTPGSRTPLCLGVLPDLGASLSDPESSDVASHCVHQIRNQIEAIRDPHSGYVLAVTSPFQGDGKTSIVMALGWSYAAAGYNTLLVDCDMVGRSLTRQLGLSGREGLKNALIAGELNGSISRVPIQNLSAIPVGVSNSFGPESVRRTDLQRLIDQVREHYDIILIDTGPMFGALESTPVTAVADGVVLSVRRGRSRARLEECANRLEMVGTRCVGVILNCAVRSDCNRYVSEASLAAAEEDRGARGEPPSSRATDVPANERNALVRAMQTTARARSTD
ncbi:MAG: AAA family ATPase [Phycisphaerales bacterium]|nr:AAA family ATPase [Phycisphaerales bacterium]MCI0631861.1 AAA family ATPase [Phycisphaerales bacterium]MCI0675950.1 AAA family ATPase [Phycisphaerales bacterium]